MKKWNLSPIQDEDHIFPVIDCSACGEEDVPCAFHPYMNDEEKLTPSIYCLNCQTVVTDPEIKGYVTMIDLEESGKEWYLEI